MLKIFQNASRRAFVAPAAAKAVVFWGVSSKTPVRDALCRMPEMFAERKVLLRRASRRQKTRDFEPAKTCRGAKSCSRVLVSVPSLGEGLVRLLRSKNWRVECSWALVRMFLVSKTKFQVLTFFLPQEFKPLN